MGILQLPMTSESMWPRILHDLNLLVQHHDLASRGPKRQCYDIRRAKIYRSPYAYTPTEPGMVGPLAFISSGGNTVKYFSNTFLFFKNISNFHSPGLSTLELM